MTPMKGTSTPSKRTADQETKFRRLLEDIAKHAAELALKKVDPDKDGLQEVLKRGDELKTAVAEITVAKTRELATVHHILHLLTEEPLTIGPTDGSEILANADDVFSYIDPDFRGWKADEPGEATGAVPAKVYELAQNADFAKMFGTLSGDTAKLCLTQAQIKAFVKQHRNWLRTDGYATFFLFKSNGKFFVAVVYFYGVGRLKIDVGHFEDDYVWDAEDRHRLVVPQLA